MHLALLTYRKGKVFDNAFVGEKSCLLEAIHSFIVLEVNHVFGDFLVEVKLEHSFIRDFYVLHVSIQGGDMGVPR